MARITTSIDIGADLEESDKSKKDNSHTHKSHPTNHPAQHGTPNVNLRWGTKSDRSRDEGPTGKANGVHKETLITPTTWVLAAAAMIFVIIFSINQFRTTEDFPGIEKAVAKQMDDALTFEVSQSIAKDYKSVSEARKRYMFNQKFEEVRKSIDFKQIVKDKQETTKDLFRDEHGMPYLYSPESYRYAESAKQELSIGQKTGNRKLSADDLAAGRAIATFHKYSSAIRPSESIDWSAFYLPVAVGAIVIALISSAAFFLTKDPASILFTGLALSMHPFAIGMFSAGSPHPSTTYLIPFTIALSMLSLAGMIKGWRSLIPLAVMIVAFPYLDARSLPVFGHILLLVVGTIMIHRAITQNSSPKIMTGTILLVFGALSLYYIGQPSLNTLKTQTLLIGRGVIVLAAISVAYSIWGIIKKREGATELACAAAALIGAMIASNRDPSGILSLIIACGLIGAAGSYAYKAVAQSFTRNSTGAALIISQGSVLALTLLLIAGSSYLAAGSSVGIVLPGVDDSVANASLSLKLDAKTGAVFLSDLISSDPISYMSGVRPTLVNTSDPGLISLFFEAMASSDENRSRAIIEALTCPAVSEALIGSTNHLSDATIRSYQQEKSGECPQQRYLVITDRSYSQLNEYAAQFGIDTQGQRLTMPTQCEIKPAGGIRCGNGFEVLDLNATIQGEFPARMVSFIGNKHIVPYQHNKVQESFVIYRENDKLYSTILPNTLDASFLVRALGHDNIPFLEEIASSGNPTHLIIYKLVDPAMKKAPVPAQEPGASNQSNQKAASPATKT